MLLHDNHQRAVVKHISNAAGFIERNSCLSLLERYLVATCWFFCLVFERFCSHTLEAKVKLYLEPPTPVDMQIQLETVGDLMYYSNHITHQGLNNNLQ